MPIGRRVAASLLLLLTAPAFAADGDPDPSFSGDGKVIYSWPGTTVQAEVRSATTGADGSVLVGGWLSYTSGQQYFSTSVLRLRNDGEPDPAFGNQGVALLPFSAAPRIQQSIEALRLWPDGRVLAFGRVARSEGSSAQIPVLARLTANGQPDATFGSGGLRQIGLDALPAAAEFSLAAAVWQPDGKVVGVGACRGCGAVPAEYDMIALRVGADGNLDSAFGSNGWARIARSGNEVAQAVALDDLGRILVLGQQISNEGNSPLLLRLTAAGNADNSFGTGGIKPLSCPFGGPVTCHITAIAAGRTPGTFFARRYFLAAYRSDQSGVIALDTSGDIYENFGVDGFLDLSLEEGSRITTVAVDAAGRLLAAGTIDPTGPGVADFLVARAGFDGDLDPRFDGNGVARYAFEAGGPSYDTPRAIAFTAQRPVIAGGLYNSGLGKDYTGVLRLQEDLLFANSFD